MLLHRAYVLFFLFIAHTTHLAHLLMHATRRFFQRVAALRHNLSCLEELTVNKPDNNILL